MVWGAGELGGRVARAWAAAGRPTLAVTATRARHAALEAAGVTCVTASESPPTPLDGDDLVLLTLPGTRAQGEGVVKLASSDRSAPARVVLASSTSYYGASVGVLDEAAPPGTGEDACAVATVEQRFRDAVGTRGVVIRLGGLYCEGRGPYAAFARRRTAPLGAPNKALALIHYDDAARAIVRVLELEHPAGAYLAVTPPCPTRYDFYAAACARLAGAMPSFGAPLAHHPATYDVTRLRRDLLLDPAHPDWRAALA